MLGAPGLDAPAPRSGHLVRLAAPLALLVAVVHFASYPVANLPLRTDVRYYVYFAWRVVEGDTPHLDLFDPKTQLATFAGAAFHALGKILGFEPLTAIRVGFLALAALGAWLAFFLLRRITGSALAGLVGVLTACAFGLLGELPAQGPVPKLLMGAALSAAAVLAGRGRWFAAGIAAGLAFMDWQVGGVVGLALVATALWTQAGWRACLAIVLGGLAGLAPFLVFFAWRGALGEAADQTLFAAFVRGSASAQAWGPGERLARLTNGLVESSQGQAWLLAPALLGIPWAIVSFARGGRGERSGSDPGPIRALGVASLGHLGVLAFSALDFQARGDALAVVQGMAFFLALFLAAAGRGVARFARARLPERARPGLAALALVLVALAARPGPLRAPYRAGWHRSTLAEQRRLAGDLDAVLGDRRVAVVERCELLYLMGRSNPLPFVYWNAATWGRYRSSPEESAQDALRRWLASVDAEALIVTTPQPAPRSLRYGLRHPGAGWRSVTVRAADETQSVIVHLRRDG